MSGHSKWNNIAKRKGANDAKKAKIFTKIGREIAVAVKEGDTPETLQRRVMEEAEWILLPQAVSLFCQGKLSVEDGVVHIAE